MQNMVIIYKESMDILYHQLRSAENDVNLIFSAILLTK